MGRNQLIIDNQIADVFTDADVVTAISYMISNINNLEGSNNPTTKTMKLPGTSRNKRIFGFPDDLTVADFKGQKVNLIGTIREGGTDILTGVVNLKDVTRTGNEVVFNITIIGNSGEWVKIMQDADLKGINLWPAIQKTAARITSAQSGLYPDIYGIVNNGFTGGQVSIESIEDDGGGFCMCILDGTNSILNLRDNFVVGDQLKGYMFDKSAYNVVHTVWAVGTIALQEATKNYIRVATPYQGDGKGVFRGTRAKLVVEDRPLMISIWYVLTKIFNLSGYTISSNFISSDFFKKLYFLPGKEKQSIDFVTLNATNIGLVSNYTATNITAVSPFPFNKAVKNDAHLWSTSLYKFTATEAMHGVFRVSINIKGTDDYIVNARFVVNGDTNTYLKTNRPETFIKLESGSYKVLEQEAELRLQSGDYFTVSLLMPQIGGVSGYVNVSTDQTFIDCEITDKVIKGSTITIGDMLPEIKQIDFVKALRHAFNLYFLTDISMKTVYIEPRNSFYRSDKVIDLSEKLDTSKPVIYEELGGDLTKTVIFKYKEDSSDWGVKEWERVNKMKFSQYKASILNVFANNGETAIENPLFAPTIMASFLAIGLTAQFPKIWQEVSEGDTIPEFLDEFTPRLLYFDGVKTCPAGESWNFEGVNQSTFPYFYSKDDATENNNSLLFETGALNMELYRKHYENYIRTQNEGRKITAYFKISAGDIQALMTLDSTGVNVKDFRSQVYFRHRGEVSHCRLDSVLEYKPGALETTKIVLVTDVDNMFGNWVAAGVPITFTNNVLAIPTAYASGCVYLSSWNWADAHDRATGAAVSGDTSHGIGAAGGIWDNSPYMIERAFLFFDTSAIPDSAVIYSAYLDIYKLTGFQDHQFTVFQGTQANILTSADYQHFGSVPFGESSGLNLGYKRVYLNAAGIASINKTGYSKFCLRESFFDVGNTPSFAMAQSIRTYFTGAPSNCVNKLTIKYTL